MDDNVDLYEILEVPKDVSQKDLKKKYKELVKQHHPDRDGSDGEKMLKINKAYDILSDPDKRKLYDQGGLSALYSHSGAGGESEHDIFDILFGKKKSVLPINVTLEDLYKGNTKKFDIKNPKTCDVCDGVGAKPGDYEMCAMCRGAGRVTMHIANMTTYQQCASCYGAGGRVKSGRYCPKCNGKGRVTDSKLLVVEIPKGSTDGDKLVFPGYGEPDRRNRPTDLYIMLKEKPHSVFKRSNENLFMKLSITINESLTGFSKKITTISGEEVILQVPCGEMTSSEDRRVIRNYGMPLKKNPSLFGDLVVSFDIKYPTTAEVPIAALEQIEKLLPPKEAVSEDGCRVVSSHVIHGDGHDLDNLMGEDDEMSSHFGANMGGRAEQISCNST